MRMKNFYQKIIELDRLETWNPKIYDKFLVKDQDVLAQECLGNVS